MDAVTASPAETPTGTPTGAPAGTTAGSAADDGLLALLARERAAFLAEVARVPTARRGERPAPERWSAAEVVEHVTRIDRGVGRLLALRAAEPLVASPDELATAQLTPARVARVRSRAERIEAPERVRPTGAVAAEAALEQLAAARAALVAAYQSADPTMLDGAVHPHPLLGPITLRGWVELAAHHDARHARQVAELADAWAERVPSGQTAHAGPRAPVRP